MQTENDTGNNDGKTPLDSEEEKQDANLQWLLDMDYQEAEETLFTVSEEQQGEQELSAYEAEVASRPLTRGNAASDDLTNYVDEEIVISSESSTSDIYHKQEEAPGAVQSAANSGFMAVDYSRERSAKLSHAVAKVDDGTDILGLASEDDIGEKHLKIQRVRKSSQGSSKPSDVKAAVNAGATSAASSSDSVALSQSTHAGTEANSATASQWVDTHIDGTQPSDDGRNADGLDDELIASLEGFEEISLTDAPIPKQVADPESDFVANESSIHDPFDFDLDADGDDDVAATETLAGLQEAGLSDSEIDHQIDQLGVVDMTLDDLLESTALADSQDSLSQPGGDETLDLHTDFQVSQTDDANIDLGRIAAVIGAGMDQIVDLVAARSQQLGMSSDAVAVESMVCSTDDMRTQYAAYGYVQINELIGDVPQPFQELHSEELAAIYLQLKISDTDMLCNDLFTDAFEPMVTEASSTPLGDDLNDSDFDAKLKTDLEAGLEGLSVEELDPGEDIDSFFFDVSGDAGEEDSVFDAEVEKIVSEIQGQGEDSEFWTESEVAQPIDQTQNTAESDADSVDQEQDEVTTDSTASETKTSAKTKAKPKAKAKAKAGSKTDAKSQSDRAASSKGSAGTKTAASNSSKGFYDIAAMSGDDMSWCVPEFIEFNYASQSNGEIFADFLDAFIEEGSAEIEKLETLVGEWEKDVSSESVEAEVSRTLHTIKGIAKGVGLQRLGTLIHNFETLLDGLPEPQENETQGYFRIINAWLDAVVRGVDHVTDERTDIESELPVITVDIAAKDEPKTNNALEEAEATTQIGDGSDQDQDQDQDQEEGDVAGASLLQSLENKRDQQLADEGAKALAAQQSVRITSEKLDHLLNLASQAQQLGVRASQNTNRSKRSSTELQGRLTSVRTHIRKITDKALFNVNARGGRSSTELDALEMDQYSELQEAASILSEGVEDLTELVDLVSRQNSQVELLLKQQSTVISSISSSIQGARVVPVSRLIPGLRRIVRTVSRDLGKVVAFKVLNETGALDRDHYARLQIVLEHMVRNALDHGIETPEERVAAGKPTGGRITIDVTKSGGDYSIRLSDDGRGMDPEALRESAYKKGLDVDVDELTDDEALQLIFHKGFSTADTLSEISGRGVGMDIVITELQQMGGDIQTKSTLGEGTSFEIRIPSNVTVNGALLVSAADDSYAIPLNGLIAVEQVPVDDFFNAVAQCKKLTLGDIECEPAYLGTLCQGVPLPDRAVWDAFVPVIVAGSESRHMVIAIDNLEEALELVVRSLGSQFSTVPGVAGAATTSDGEAIVALDLNLMVRSAGADGIASVGLSKSEDNTLLVLVVDDSRTQRLVATSQLDSIGVESVTAENGLVAIDLLNTAHRLPDVILLDVEMPVKDGIQTLKEIRNSKRYNHLPVIMVTSRTGAKHRALAKEAGCNAYMGKPFNFPALIEQINELTGYDLQVS